MALDSARGPRYNYQIWNQFREPSRGEAGHDDGSGRQEGARESGAPPGRARVARRLRAAGAQVALLDLPGERLEAARAELGDGVLAAPADVRAPAEVRAAVESARDAFGGLDTLVISAGVIHIKPLGEVSEVTGT